MNERNKQTDLKEQHSFYCSTLFMCVADPATSLASDSVLAAHFPVKTAGLFTDAEFVV